MFLDGMIDEDWDWGLINLSSDSVGETEEGWSNIIDNWLTPSTQHPIKIVNILNQFANTTHSFMQKYQRYELFDKVAAEASGAGSDDCKECICNLMTEYANYAGVRNSEGICEQDNEALFCGVDAEIARRKEGKISNYEATACILGHWFNKID